MEDIEQIWECIGKLADKVYDLEGKVDDSEISRIMREITDLNRLEIKLANRKRPKRKLHCYDNCFP